MRTDVKLVCQYIYIIYLHVVVSFGGLLDESS